MNRPFEAFRPTDKRPGDIVLGNSTRPAWRVPKTCRRCGHVVTEQI